MARVEWDNKYSMQIGEIDKQHMRIVDMINDLSEAVENSETEKVIEKILNEMVDYSTTHFFTEEKYMVRFDYNHYHEHKNEHDVFVHKIIEFQRKFMDNRDSLSSEVMDFLANWLFNHIAISDKKYAPLFKENGL